MKDLEVQTGRERLPPRRSSVTETILWGNHAINVTFGFNAHGRIAEVFAGNGDGNDLAHLTNDAAIVLSIALQQGVSLTQLNHSLGTVPAWDGADAPASLIGAIVAHAITLEQELWA
ncbi:hypothetical protein [Falsiruegeria mediterranea]|uniref:ribonucleoside-diphosphate reductase n=1 Tax=Falsiruegeria mediterranea M17 TaxID=1200281 RepID=A0A2R8C8D4_9RHOB|nr:hypothetical protein [Falsiruegeria mediterranea]SPJ28662.1 hypothetical protein TRM7615_02165 [Falsiruegeria mediterranea M17]